MPFFQTRAMVAIGLSVAIAACSAPSVPPDGSQPLDDVSRSDQDAHHSTDTGARDSARDADRPDSVVLDSAADVQRSDSASDGDTVDATMVDSASDSGLDAAAADSAADAATSDGDEDVARFDGAPDAFVADSALDALPDAIDDAPCPGGEALCSGACVDTTRDDRHCGACGRSCGGAEYCRSGTCVADPCVGVTCAASDACHQPNACNRATGRCAPTVTSGVVDALGRSPLVGVTECVGGSGAPVCNRRPYANALNRAAVSNGARAAVSSGALAGLAPMHQTSNLNDGYYGNGSSWIAASGDGWVKLDLGRSIALERVTIGRDRLGGFSDRAMGAFTIAVAESEAVYAEGDATGDAFEYRTVFDSRQRGSAGETIALGQTLTVTFAPVSARYIKIAMSTSGACIDEIEAFGCDPAMTSCPAMPSMSIGACEDGVASTIATTCDRGICTGGAACPASRLDCDGDAVNACEIDGAADDRHCGACGRACLAGTRCFAGACLPPCAAPSIRCGSGAASACVDPNADSMHCGGCGRACTASQYCSAGACIADPCASVVCGASDVCHQRNSCDRSTGRCASNSTSAVAGVAERSMFSAAPFCISGTAPACTLQPFATTTDRASTRNGARGAVSSGGLAMPPNHQTSNVNDGHYGNGSSWISSAANGWVKIDLGRTIALDRVTLGRDRTGNFGDRPLGAFTVAVADSDAVYAEGDSTNDATEYRVVFDSALRGRTGESLALGETVSVTFAPVLARFIKVSMATNGACLDEVEAFGCDPAMMTCVALPSVSIAACDDGLLTTTDTRCDRGVCGGGTVCAAGRLDCDNDAMNACEVDTQTDVSNCGACGNACAAGLNCVAGVCRPPFVATPLATPTVVPGTAGCVFGVDNFNQQVAIASDGGVWLVARCGAELRVARSIDGAASFSNAGNIAMTVAASGVTAIVPRSRTEAFLFAANRNAVQVLHTVNGGASWTPRASPSPAMSINGWSLFATLSVAARGRALYVTYTSTSWVSQPAIYVSTDDAATWSPIAAPTPLGNIYTFDLFAPGETDLVFDVSTSLDAQHQLWTGASWARQHETWGEAGSVYADFALAGSRAYYSVGGSGPTVLHRWRLGALSSVVALERTITSGEPERSLDVDSTGNLWFAIRASASGTVQIQHWATSSGGIDPGVLWTTANPTPLPAIAAIPYQLGSVTAVTTAAAVHVVTVVR